MHASHRYARSGLNCWLAQILRANLQEVAPWLLKDSKDFVARIGDIPRQDITRWHVAAIDVKDFYLNGSAEAIAKAAVSLWPDHDPMRTTLRRIILFALGNQFVGDPWGLSDNITYPVTEGSGMGLLCSGEVAESALVSLMKRANHEPDWRHGFRWGRSSLRARLCRRQVLCQAPRRHPNVLCH